MNLTTVRDNLKTRLQTISGLRVYDTIPADVRLPAAVIGPGEPYVDYDFTMGGGTVVRFVVRLYASKASERGAQDKLDGYASDGANSIYAAVEGDGSLAGAIDSARAVRARNFGAVTVAGVDYLVIDFDVECITT